MGEENSGDKESSTLINVEDVTGLSKIGKTLIDKVSDAVGGIAKPWQIKRVAKAEAEAGVITAEGQIQVSEIQERGLQRMIVEEGKAQANIESITAKALPNLKDSAKPDEVEDDWITHFFDRSRLVSDDEMQTLWAGILSGEANEPRSFSKRTIDLVATLDQADAEMFAKFCSFVWMISGTHKLITPGQPPVWKPSPLPMIINSKDEILNNHGINFGALNHLEDIGLIRFSEVSSYERQNLPNKIIMIYYGHPLIIELPKSSDNTFEIGKVLLTNAGQQLVPICTSRPVEKHYENMTSYWMNRGYPVSCAVASKDFHKPF